jgi:hypothetical protein
LPTTIVVDNGPEFAGRPLDAWTYARQAPFHSTRQAGRTRVRRELQREVSGRVPERTLSLSAWPTPSRPLKRGGSTTTPCGRTPRWPDRRRSMLQDRRGLTGGCRLVPRRPKNPRTSHYPRSGSGGQVRTILIENLVTSSNIFRIVWQESARNHRLLCLADSVQFLLPSPVDELTTRSSHAIHFPKVAERRRWINSSCWSTTERSQ